MLDARQTVLHIRKTPRLEVTASGRGENYPLQRWPATWVKGKNAFGYSSFVILEIHVDTSVLHTPSTTDTHHFISGQREFDSVGSIRVWLQLKRRLPRRTRPEFRSCKVGTPMKNCFKSFTYQITLMCIIRYSGKKPKFVFEYEKQLKIFFYVKR